MAGVPVSLHSHTGLWTSRGVLKSCTDPTLGGLLDYSLRKAVTQSNTYPPPSPRGDVLTIYKQYLDLAKKNTVLPDDKVTKLKDPGNAKGYRRALAEAKS